MENAEIVPAGMDMSICNAYLFESWIGPSRLAEAHGKWTNIILLIQDGIYYSNLYFLFRSN